MMTSGMTSSDSQEWGTPDTLYLPLNEKWNFTLDGAAAHGNTKVDRYCTADGMFKTCTPPDGDPTTRSPGEGCEHGGSHFENPFGWSHMIDARDGLQFPWGGERVWLNPPWGDPEQPCGQPCTKKRCAKRGWHAEEYIPGVEDFLRKAVQEVLWNRATVVAVIPARTDTQWFHRWVLPYRPLFRRGRPQFIDPATGQPGKAPPVGICIVEYR